MLIAPAMCSSSYSALGKHLDDLGVLLGDQALHLVAVDRCWHRLADGVEEGVEPWVLIDVLDGQDQLPFDSVVVGVDERAAASFDVQRVCEQPVGKVSLEADANLAG